MTASAATGDTTGVQQSGQIMTEAANSVVVIQRDLGFERFGQGDVHDRGNVSWVAGAGNSGSVRRIAGGWMRRLIARGGGDMSRG